MLRHIRSREQPIKSSSEPPPDGMAQTGLLGLNVSINETQPGSINNIQMEDNDDFKKIFLMEVSPVA